MSVVEYKGLEERDSCEFLTDVVITLAPEEAATLAAILGALRGGNSVVCDIYDGLTDLNEDIAESRAYKQTKNRINSQDICF